MITNPMDHLQSGPHVPSMLDRCYVNIDGTLRPRGLLNYYDTKGHFLLAGRGAAILHWSASMTYNVNVVSVLAVAKAMMFRYWGRAENRHAATEDGDYVEGNIGHAL